MRGPPRDATSVRRGARGAGRGRRALRRHPWWGANVSVPHKDRRRPLDGRAPPAARRLGAVNTIVRDGERLIGDNTDLPGFARALAALGAFGSRVRRWWSSARAARRARWWPPCRPGRQVALHNRRSRARGAGRRAGCRRRDGADGRRAGGRRSRRRPAGADDHRWAWRAARRVAAARRRAPRRGRRRRPRLPPAARRCCARRPWRPAWPSRTGCRCSCARAAVVRGMDRRDAAVDAMGAAAEAALGGPGRGWSGLLAGDDRPRVG